MSQKLLDTPVSSIHFSQYSVMSTSYPSTRTLAADTNHSLPATWTESDELGLLRAVLEIALEPAEAFDPRISLFTRIKRNLGEKRFTSSEILAKVKGLRRRYEDGGAHGGEAFDISHRIWGLEKNKTKTRKIEKQLAEQQETMELSKDASTLHHKTENKCDEQSKPMTSPRSKVNAPAEIRLTASFCAYYDFMKKIAPRMHERHWNAYDGCTFVHYVIFGPPGVDRPTLELCLRNYNKNLENFQFRDAKTGNKMDCTFDLDWVHNHTGFVTDGEIIHRNRDPNNRIWKMYFADKQVAGKNGRRYVEGLLEMLVDSKSHKDVEDFVLLQILYQCSMIWCPSSVQGIPRHLFKYVDSIERVKSVAWGRFIFSEIKEGIDIALAGLKEPGVTYVPGCMPLIPLWYYEMTGIKKYALSNSKKPPLTNWVLMGEKAGSLRTETIISKAEKASIVFVEKPIAEAGDLKEKYPLMKDDISHRKRKANTELFVRKDNVQSPNKKARETMKDKRTKSKDKEKKDTISSIVAKIEEAISREDEIEKLPIKEQLVFWRNAAKINQKIFEVTMRETILLCDSYGKEIRNLNKRLKVFDAKADVFAPENIKEKINNKIARKKRAPNLVLVNSHRSTLNIEGKSQIPEKISA